MNGSRALRRPSILLMLLVALNVQPALAQDEAVAWKTAIQSHLNGIYPTLGSLYEDIHASPELAFQEVKTAARLASEMRALGFQVVENVGKTGVVAIYRNGPGPTVMVRTELDALPMEEKTGLPYASKARALWQGRDT